MVIFINHMNVSPAYILIPPNLGVGIVSCTWRKDQMSCTTAPGYEISSTVTDHLVIRVPRASRDHSGSYVCLMTGSKIESFEPCVLIVMPGISFIFGGVEVYHDSRQKVHLVLRFQLMYLCASTLLCTLHQQLYSSPSRLPVSALFNNVYFKFV